MKKSKNRVQFLCQECGYDSPKWFGRCPSCQAWNTCQSINIAPKEGYSNTHKSLSLDDLPLKPINEVNLEEIDRLNSGIEEFDRVLGGGIIPGEIILIGGEPGIGKSTLLLQVAEHIAQNYGKVIYISGEESLQQLSLRAKRLNISSPELFVTSLTDLDNILALLEKEEPFLVIVDSIQSIYYNQLPSAPGSVAQIKECASRLLRQAKEKNLPIILIGHITKIGDIAGPRLLEHIVDAVLYLEGEKRLFFRILRSVKNRFGSVNEIGIFEMRERGMVEVPNPSTLFLTAHNSAVAGSVICSIIEGSRPLLIEVQALCTPTNSFSPARRVVAGVDQRRVAMLLAVVEKKMQLPISQQDVYINIVGGLQVEETGLDLAICLAAISSFSNRPLPDKLSLFGEVGLGGEIRAIGQVLRRLNEAARLGIKHCLVPEGNLKGLQEENIQLEMIPVSSLQQAVEKVGL